MSRCLETDTLVSVGAALAWNTEEGLRHIAECEACREQLHELAALRGDLARVMEPATGFTDRVMDSIDARSAAPASLSGIGVLNSVFAGMTVFIAIGYSAAGAAQTPAGLPAVLMSMAAAGATLWWNWSHGSSGVDTVR